MPYVECIEGVDAAEQQTNARRGALRHQSILSIDMPTWREVVNAFKIRTPMIPHREEQKSAGPGARGWYS